MINREKVIRHIIAEISIAKTCKKDFASVDIDMLSDALDMLKEQESVIEVLKSDLDETLAVLGEQPEIIRCKECKYWLQLYGDNPFYSHVGCCDCDDMWRSLDGETNEVNDIRTDSDFYCGYADRR